MTGYTLVQLIPRMDYNRELSYLRGETEERRSYHILPHFEKASLVL